MEQWQKDLQKNLLQKAVNTEFGYNMPVEDMIIKKAKAYPEGTVQMWGNSPYVKTGGKWVLQRKLKEQKKDGGGEEEKKANNRVELRQRTGWIKGTIIDSKPDENNEITIELDVPLRGKKTTKWQADDSVGMRTIKEEKKETPAKTTGPGTKIKSTGNLPWEAGHTAGAGFKSNEQIAKEDREAATGEKEDESKGKFMQGRPKNPELRNINTGKKI